MENLNDIHEKSSKKKTLLSAAIILVLIPLTVFLSFKYLGSGKYMITSIIIIGYIMTPFFLVFEKRKPQARELVVISVMSALSIIGNLTFFMMTPFQAGTAMVMITGIAFGPEAGFLCGALARFVCNFFAGQGIWTPFQMFSWGILGFISGIVFNKNAYSEKKQTSFKFVMGPLVCIAISLAIGYVVHLLWGNGTFLGWRLYVFGAAGLLTGILIQRKRLPIDKITLPIFGFLATFIIYGGIMNIAAMVMSSMVSATGITMSLESLGILYISGVPYDAVHAASSAFFLFILGEKCIEKAERVKIKYGLYD